MEVTRGWTHRSFPIGDASRVGEVRRHVVALASDMGWGDEDMGRSALVATELATNLVRHARDAEIWIAARPPMHDIEIICVDRGPGIEDIATAMQDGVSTGSGSPGTGLGAISRVADDFFVVSEATGTVSLARLREGRRAPSALSLRMGAVCLAVAPETISGDAWAVRSGAGLAEVLVADGLGHGPLAGEAARAAVDVFASQNWNGNGNGGADAAMPLEEFVAQAHAALRGTRGAALLAVRFGAQTVHSCGAGNISGRLFNGVASLSLSSQHGTAGVQISRPRVADCSSLDHGVLVLHSDGVSARWKHEDYAGLLGRDPGLLAACLLWHNTRSRDDATVVVLKAEEAQ
ncbi:ATP-binding protein [Delftia acidovorans]|uniref:ATP-binding protein n=1 Tax=Delftia acidovorans TaxID=80866 RepID=UPI0035A17682